MFANSPNRRPRPTSLLRRSGLFLLLIATVLAAGAILTRAHAQAPSKRPAEKSPTSASSPNKKSVAPDKPASSPKVRTPEERIAELSALFKALSSKDEAELEKIRHKRFEIPEDDLNLYIEDDLQKHPRFGIKKAKVHLRNNNTLSADSVVDFEAVREEDRSLMLRLVSWFLRGDQKLHTEAQFFFEGRSMTYRIDKCTLNDTSLSPRLAEKVVEIIARRQDPPLDTTKPIELPPTIRDVKFQNALLIIVT